MAEAAGALAFSIVLCTRNRVRLLGDALESLCGIDYPHDEFELVLIDNDSSDATAAAARRFAERAPFGVRVFRETTLGLSAARNRGISEARGRWLFFTDDDQLVDPAVLREHQRVSETYGARAIQGSIELDFPDGRPPWLRGELERVLGKTDDVAEGICDIDLYGGNMCFERALFHDVAAFREDLGKGRAGYSEDLELTRRLRAMGERIAYAPGATIYHVIKRDRATRRFYLHNSFVKGYSDGLTHDGVLSADRVVSRGIKGSARHLAQAALCLLRGDGAGAMLGQTRAANALGRMMGAARNRINR